MSFSHEATRTPFCGAPSTTPVSESESDSPAWSPCSPLLEIEDEELLKFEIFPLEIKEKLLGPKPFKSFGSWTFK